MSWHRHIAHEHGPVRHSLRCGGLAALIGALLGTIAAPPGVAEATAVQATATARARIIASSVRAAPAPSVARAGRPSDAPSPGDRRIERPCDGAAAASDCRLIIRDMP